MVLEDSKKLCSKEMPIRGIDCLNCPLYCIITDSCLKYEIPIVYTPPQKEVIK